MKNLRVLTTPRAQDDIDEHAFYIAGDKLDAGLRVLHGASDLPAALDE